MSVGRHKLKLSFAEMLSDTCSQLEAAQYSSSLMCWPLLGVKCLVQELFFLFYLSPSTSFVGIEVTTFWLYMSASNRCYFKDIKLNIHYFHNCFKIFNLYNCFSSFCNYPGVLPSS